MQRSPRLQHLSREHHHALALAKKCQRAAQSDDADLIALTCQQVMHDYEMELKAHFEYEESVLLPLLRDAADSPLCAHTRSDHHELVAMLQEIRQNSRPALAHFGKRLTEHVRFEERELFPRLETLF